MPSSMRRLTIGTRRSPLARMQTEIVSDRLREAWPSLKIIEVCITAEGDQHSGPLRGGKGLFTSALEEAVVLGDVDIAVHSLKDLPIDSNPRVTLGAVLDRSTARDVLMSPWTLSALPAGARIGTSSLRRRAQLKAFRPDIAVVPMRGNVGTRLRKLKAGAVDGIVLAQAGLRRLDIPHEERALLPLSVMLPAPGQGALAVQCRAAADEIAAFLKAVDCPKTRRATTAERSFLAALGGGCAAPVAAFAQTSTNGPIRMQGMVASTDGSSVIRVQDEGHDPRSLGIRLAQRALSQGANTVLHGC